MMRLHQLIVAACAPAAIACHGPDSRTVEEHVVASVPPSVDTSARVAADGRLWMEMHHVDLRIDDHAALHIDDLRGEVRPTRSGEIPFLDDVRSFSVRITSGRVRLTPADLEVLLNRFVFGYPGAPLRRLRIRIDGDHLIQRGVLHKGVDLPFEITATLALDPDGRIRLHPVHTRILGMNGGWLLRVLGTKLERQIDVRRAVGVSIDGNDFLLDPARIIPPPAIVGTAASVHLEGQALVQEFRRLADDTVFTGASRSRHVGAGNFVYFRGSRLRFGKLLMTGTDLLIVDGDASDPFDLFLARYNRQLVAGTSRTLPNLGLRVVMPDYHDLGHERAATHRLLPDTALAGGTPFRDTDSVRRLRTNVRARGRS